jgi:hypothetical protein
LYAVVVKEVANALTLQCNRRQEFEKISNAPPLQLSRMSRRQIEGDCRRANTAVLPQLLKRLLRSLAIAVFPLSRIWGDCWLTAIVIVKEVAPLA